jgi:porin
MARQRLIQGALSCLMARGAWLSVALIVLTLAATGVQAQTAAPPVEEAPASESEAYPDLQLGTLSAEGELDADEAPKVTPFRFPTLLGPWMEFKETIRQATGISFGGSYGVLWQNYEESFLGEDNSVGGKFAFNFSKDILFSGAPNALVFDMAVEARHPLGTDQPPLWAGLSAGSITATAATWGEFDLGITQAYIRQDLFDGRVQYTIGKIFAPNYVNAYPFFDDNRQFLNQNFSTSPTIPIPLRGFGMAGAVYPIANFYVSGGVYTPYSDDTGWTIDDFIEKNDYFYNVEIGWTSLARSGVPLQARGPMDANNFSITPWYRDPLEDGSPEAYGVAFNANYLLLDNLMGFFRGGWSHGWVIDRNLAFGLGYRPTNAPSDLLGVGFGWARPTSEFLPDQYTAEMFYRFQVTPQFAVTPDAQLIIDPALNPKDDVMWALGIRSRLTF